MHKQLQQDFTIVTKTEFLINMENSEITISITLAVINVVGLAVGYNFDKFKITAICLVILDVLTIMAMTKLI